MLKWLFGTNGKDEIDKAQQAYDDAWLSNFSSAMEAKQMRDMRADPANADLFKRLNEQIPAFDANWNNSLAMSDLQRRRAGDELDELSKNVSSMRKANKHNYFGNGLLGSILNPIGQTATAGLDLITGNYEANDRDVISDLGAAGQTVLTLLPGGAGVAGKLGFKGLSKGLGTVNKALYTIPGSIGTGAAFGVFNKMADEGKDLDIGDAISAAGSGALSGGIFGTATKLPSMLRNRGANKISQALVNRGVDPSQIGNILGGVSKGNLYQAALGGFNPRNLIPQSTFGKLALGGAGLYGASRLLGGGQQQAQPEAMTLEDYYQMGGY